MLAGIVACCHGELPIYKPMNQCDGQPSGYKHRFVVFEQDTECPVCETLRECAKQLQVGADHLMQIKKLVFDPPAKDS